MDFLNYHNVSVVLHLLGVVTGMGGAVASDLIFFSSIRDKKISHDETRFLRLGSKMVWAGLAIIIISGVFLFFENTERYFNSAKFMAKMTIVAILTINGAVFHFVHMPRLHRYGDGRSAFLFVSGAVSIVSWTSALVLGVLGRLTYTYFEIMGVYVVFLLIAVACAILLKNKTASRLK